MSFRRLVKLFIPSGLFKRIEPLGHLFEAVLFNALYGFPARNMKVIGVTGTNGKTTTSYLIYKMLQESGYNVGLNTTVAYGVNDDIRPQLHHMTNVSVPELMKRLRWFKKQNIEWLVLETTSHALAQNRVWGVPFSVSVLTNLTHEHLGYHGTFEKYRDAKKKLFTLTGKNRRGLQMGVINADDPVAELFARETPDIITYGQEKGHLRAQNVELTSSGSQFSASIGGDEYQVTCNLPGSFNVSNALAAVAVGRAVGLHKRQIEQGLAALHEVEGRMTRVNEGQNFDVVVDYAHSPDSFEKLFADIRPVVKGKLIALFGSLGGGDTAKRPEQGRIAAEYADEVVLTEEDNRQEDPKQIIDDIAAGVKKTGKKLDKDYFVVPKRVDAIEFALKRAKKGDMVLLLGKGHEKTIEDADGEHPWNEAEIATKSLRKLQKDTILQK